MHKYIFIIVVFIFIIYTGESSAQTDYKVIKKVADYIVENTSSKIINTKTKELFDSTKGLPVSKDYRVESPYQQWEYENGVLAIAMIRLAESSDDEKYSLYVQNNYNFIFDNLSYFEKLYKGGLRWGSFYQLFSMSLLDHCGAMGAGLCDVYEYDSQKRYKKYLNSAVDYISNDELRLEDRTLVRSWPREMTLWADDLYMSVPFLSRMAKITGDDKYFDDAITQVKNFNKYLFNKTNGLYYHCYYTDNNKNGVAHWGRCNGWIVMAEVELLNLLPENHPERNNLIKILEEHIIGLSRHQDLSGMWHQLLDKPDSYLESSATSMFVYGIAKAVNEGWINESYATIAKDGWDALAQRIEEDGQVEDICIGTGIQDNIRFYYERSTKLNDIHGLGSIIMAGVEMIKLNELLQKSKK